MFAYSVGICEGDSGSGWIDRFHKEIGATVSPFAKYVISNPVRVWYHCDYLGDGRGNFVNVHTGKTIYGYTVPDDLIFEKYTWPAELSVAFLFKEELPAVLTGLAVGRAERFAKSQRNLRHNQYHNITGVRTVKFECQTEKAASTGGS